MAAAAAAGAAADGGAGGGYHAGPAAKETGGGGGAGKTKRSKVGGGDNINDFVGLLLKGLPRGNGGLVGGGSGRGTIGSHYVARQCSHPTATGIVLRHFLFLFFFLAASPIFPFCGSALGL